MGRKKSDSYDSSRQEIVKAAVQLVSEKGIYGASLSQIAAALGISKGTLYYYYPSKEVLVNDITEYYLDTLTGIFVDWLQNLPQNIPIRLAFCSLFDSLHSDPERAKLQIFLASQAALGNGNIKSRFEEKHREWQLFLELGALRIGDCSVGRLRSVAGLVFCMLDGTVIQKLLMEKPMLSNEDFALALETLLDTQNG